MSKRLTKEEQQELVRIGEEMVEQYLEHIAEAVLPYSYLKYPYLKKVAWKGLADGADSGVYRATPLSRDVEVCPFVNPFRDRLHFTLAVAVKGGRITRVGLGQVSVERAAGGEPRTLPAARWPRELEGHVVCLAPHLQAVAMAPAPADGSCEPAYAYGGRPDGQPAP